MRLITDTAGLAGFCEQQMHAEFVTVDTEFMRDRTYWPDLCLVQVAGPDEAAAIDPLGDGIDLRPLFKLMAAPAVLKVFHAARQDIEIFYKLMGAVPAPLFDTQVAAMVCGFGESASYETLAGKLAGVRIDKSARFTDWSHRPLTDRQIHYALSDVVPLRTVYEKLQARLQRNDRAAWLEEEIKILTDPSTYTLDPRESWRRFKLRGGSRRTLALLRELAAWREIAAQQRNLPRNRILRDEQVMEIAAHAPSTPADLARTRGLGKGFVEGRFGGEVLEVIRHALALPEHAHPEAPARRELPPGLGPLVDLLRVLLKLRCEEHGVAQKLVASAEDLELIAAADSADVPALSGWRRELFGEDALALKHGRIALTAAGKQIQLVRLDEPAAVDAHGSA
ncbi:MAG TPA: ribonuclease D [Stellaceae bacterium]|nr:ribonuclease D [Stellaceae bacterium]